MTCKDCAYFKLADSASDSGCYVSPAQVYNVWGKSAYMCQF